MLPVSLQTKLAARLAAGEVHFAYRKKTGELRIAKGTTNLDSIPSESHPKGTGSDKNMVKAYWDLNVEGWRAFNPEQVVWVSGLCADEMTISEQNQIIAYKEENGLK